jgi:hypothetical protein
MNHLGTFVNVRAIDSVAFKPVITTALKRAPVVLAKTISGTIIKPEGALVKIFAEDPGSRIPEAAFTSKRPHRIKARCEKWVASAHIQGTLIHIAASNAGPPVSRIAIAHK